MESFAWHDHRHHLWPDYADTMEEAVDLWMGSRARAWLQAIVDGDDDRGARTREAAQLIVFGVDSAGRRKKEVRTLLDEVKQRFGPQHNRCLDLSLLEWDIEEPIPEARRRLKLGWGGWWGVIILIKLVVGGVASFHREAVLLVLFAILGMLFIVAPMYGIRYLYRA